MLTRRAHYDDAPEYEDAYTVEGWGTGIAWRVLGWETEPDKDTEWSGYEVRTGLLSAYMVGDDQVHTFEPGELTRIDRDDYCGVCGQVGCGHG